jgi:hypothetical protein
MFIDVSDQDYKMKVGAVRTKNAGNCDTRLAGLSMTRHAAVLGVLSVKLASL